jgi:hypothetical protein
MAFAYSRKPLQQLVQDKYLGEWKYLNKALFEISEEKATRALLELGLYIRVIDDDERFTNFRGEAVYGELVDADGFKTPLRARDVANKIIHAERYDWSHCSDPDPMFVCIASKDQLTRFKWASASISLVALGSICGSLMS